MGRLVEHRLQVVPAHELEHEINLLPHDEVVVDFGDGRVREAGQQVGLALEVGQELLPLAHRGRRLDHLLDGTGLERRGEAQVARGVDRAHPTQAEHFGDLVALDQHRAAREDRPAAAARALGGSEHGSLVLFVDYGRAPPSAVSYQLSAISHQPSADG